MGRTKRKTKKKRKRKNKSNSKSNIHCAGTTLTYLYTGRNLGHAFTLGLWQKARVIYRLEKLAPPRKRAGSLGIDIGVARVTKVATKRAVLSPPTILQVLHNHEPTRQRLSRSTGSSGTLASVAKSQYLSSRGKLRY